MGAFPEKNPLNAEITGTVEGDGFSVEKVVYQSQPGFYVTAALFIPDDLKEKAPAILYCSGHTYESFRSKVYQHMIINLVNKGFIVLAFDPVGQGERLQYLNEEQNRSIFDTPTHEHSYPGGQCFISGSSIARHMIWDGIRSIDYLVSRPEVDPERIGITGRSGGGTQSAYIAAFDDRVKAAAPECYITSFEYLFKTIGPQDAEQNLPFFLEEQLDLADLLEVRMPRPALIISTTNDFFSIQGARETFVEVKKAYETYGYPERIQMAEDIGGHESTSGNREALYAFFQEALHQPGGPADREVTLFDPGELLITRTGQVLTAYQSETIYTLNKKEVEPVLHELARKRKGAGHNPDSLRQKIIDRTGFSIPVPDTNYIFSGKERYDQYTLEKYMLPGSGDHLLPVILLRPVMNFNGKAVVIYNPEGKIAEVTKETLAGWLTSTGFAVVLPDIPGFGELGPGYLKGDAYMEHTSYNQWFAGILTGKCPVSIRMEDMHLINIFTEKILPVKPGDLYGIARDVLTADLLHYQTAGAGFGKLAMIRSLVSYKALVMNRDYHPKYIQSAVPASVPEYDLPDLAAAVAPRKLLMIDICDQQGSILENSAAHPDLLPVIEHFNKERVKGKLYIMNTEGHSFDDLFSEWLQ